MDYLDENELLYLYVQGSDVAFEQLYSIFKKYFSTILNNNYKNLIYLIGLEDLLQEGMVILNRVMWEYRDDGTTLFRTYVRDCVEKKWKTIYRQQMNGKHKIHMETISLDQEYSNRSEDRQQTLYNLLIEKRIDRCPQENMYYVEQIYQAKEYLHTYSIQEQNIVYMKIDGYSNDEIASKLMVTSKKVANTIYRIKKNRKH